MGRWSPFDPLPRIEPPHKSILQKEVYLKHKYDSSALLQPFNVSPFKVQVARNSLKVRLIRLINKGQGLKPRGALTPKPSLTHAARAVPASSEHGEPKSCQDLSATNVSKPFCVVCLSVPHALSEGSGDLKRGKPTLPSVPSLSKPQARKTSITEVPRHP